MNIAIWNVRGFNHPFKQRDVVKRIKNLNVSFVCLLETRVKKDKMLAIVQKHFEGWNMLHNYDHAYNGRIWLLWMNVFQIDLISANDQCIIVSIAAGFGKFFYSCIYGWNT